MTTVYPPFPKITQNFQHLKEKQVPQYQALLPVDLEKHLYSGSTLYDLEKNEFRKINTVSKVSRKAGYTTTVTFVGGAKRILKTTEALEDFAKGHKWVSLRDVPEPHFDPYPSKPATVHHYSRTHKTHNNTNITHIGWESINELVDEKVNEALRVKQTWGVAAAQYKQETENKRRWFR